MKPPLVPVARRRRVLRWLAIVAGIYLGVMLLFLAFQRSLMYPAAVTGPLPAAEQRPPGVRLDDVTAITDDGLTLHGWRCRPLADTPQRPVVLLFHGNGGNRNGTLATAELLAALGAETLLFDYRGYAENAGSPSETGLKIDAHAVWKTATGSLGIPPERIVLFGESLGGAVAVALAADLCTAGTPPAGLMVRSTFGSIVDVAAGRFPWLPVRLALRDRWNSAGRVARVTCPVLVLHGDTDGSVPLAMGRALFAAVPPASAAGVPRQFVLLAGAGHNNVLDVSREPLTQAIDEFLNAVVAH